MGNLWIERKQQQHGNYSTLYQKASQSYNHEAADLCTEKLIAENNKDKREKGHDRLPDNKLLH